jgi:23S rRNA pseudouridine1911/1915/1917 synthase
MIPHISRSHLKKLINDGFVLVDGKEGRPGGRVVEKEQIDVTIPKVEHREIEPEEIPIDVVYEDEYLLVVEKPAGMVVHPGAGRASGTLVSALLFRGIDLSSVGGRDRPGIVHRLDKDTSGLIVVAKNDNAHVGLSLQFKVHKTERVYLGVCWGRIGEDRGRIDAPLGRHARDRKRITTNPAVGKEAVTEFEVIERFSNMTFAKFIPQTGRTHQIRVHMAHRGHPIVADKTYGSSKAAKNIKDTIIRKAVLGMKRQALHASILGFIHPVTEDPMRFESPLPNDIKSLLEVIRGEK